MVPSEGCEVMDCYIHVLIVASISVVETVQSSNLLNRLVFIPPFYFDTRIEVAVLSSLCHYDIELSSKIFGLQ